MSEDYMKIRKWKLVSELGLQPTIQFLNKHEEVEYEHTLYSIIEEWIQDRLRANKQ
jgi:hypothetical protein